MRRFREWYEAGPRSCSALYKDLRLARTDVQHDIKHFFMALNWLTVYPTESVRAGTWGLCERRAREWTWFYNYAIQSLKAQKVSSSSGLTLILPITFLHFC
jgi:hypothetical protein